MQVPELSGRFLAFSVVTLHVHTIVCIVWLGSHKFNFTRRPTCPFVEAVEEEEDVMEDEEEVDVMEDEGEVVVVVVVLMRDHQPKFVK